jgi:hypothetical protein
MAAAARELGLGLAHQHLPQLVPAAARRIPSTGGAQAARERARGASSQPSAGVPPRQVKSERTKTRPSSVQAPARTLAVFASAARVRRRNPASSAAGARVTPARAGAGSGAAGMSPPGVASTDAARK